MERESMEFDLVVVGGGPAGLSTAIKFAQLAAEANEEFTQFEIKSKTSSIFNIESFKKNIDKKGK